jgi:hypothetical protein
MMVSDCCGAMIRFQDICGRCGEHCEPAEIDTDDGYDAVKDNYLTNGGYGYNDRTRREDEEWAEECRRNKWK